VSINNAIRSVNIKALKSEATKQSKHGLLRYARNDGLRVSQAFVSCVENEIPPHGSYIKRIPIMKLFFVMTHNLRYIRQNNILTVILYDI